MIICSPIVILMAAPRLSSSEGFSFQPEAWQVLAEALRKHGISNQVVGIVESPYGTRYSVDGRLETPDERNPLVRTVWIIETGGAAPRLITAYPLR